MPYFLRHGKCGFALLFEQSRNQASNYWAFCVALRQCCGSKFFPPRIRIFPVPNPGSASKNLCTSRIRILIFTHPGSRIQGAKRQRIPDPDSNTALRARRWFSKILTDPFPHKNTSKNSDVLTHLRDAEGYFEHCRWCADGGKLLMCDRCDNVFCKSCIESNLGKTKVAEIEVSFPLINYKIK
jgi:hypothetical protein